MLAEAVAKNSQRAAIGRGRQCVLITDGDERAALAATRSLIGAGHRVVVTGPGSRTLAGVSRGAIPVVIQADPLRDPAAYVAELIRCADRFSVTVLLPISDPSVEALLERRSDLPPDLSLPFPRISSYRAASDKIRVIECARRAGLAAPESLLVESRRQIDRAFSPGIFPAIVKPHRSVVTEPGGRRIKCGVEFVADAAELRAALAALPSDAFPVLVQRRIRGPGEGMFALRWDGKIVATFGHRRLREKPPAGGISVFRESIEVDPALEAAGIRMLDELDWQGVAMIECKRDLDTGRHVLMEINGRLWGSLQLAIDAGVDFPALLVECASGQTPGAIEPYDIGVRSRWFWGDVDHLYMRMTKSARTLHLEGEFPSRLAVLRGFLSLPRAGDRDEIWRLSDPAPALLEMRRRLFGGR